MPSPTDTMTDRQRPTSVAQARNAAPVGRSARTGVTLAIAGSLACVLAGCGSSGVDTADKPRAIEPASFRAEPGSPDAVRLVGIENESQHNPVSTEGSAASGSTGASQGEPRSASGFRVVPGEPVAYADAGRPVELPQLLDAKVGDINGRPVFVSEFLGPIEGRLRAEAQRLDRESWMREAARIIQQEMRALITDELLKAEALSKLSVEQKAGLRRFLDDVRKNLVSQNRGSQQLAEERLRREEGLSQEEFLRQREDRTLVRFTLQEEIQDRINVSWRDIVQRYARDDSKYNPNPTARYYILRVDADDEEARQSVGTALAGGSSFADIASSEVNTWTLDPGGLREVSVPGALAEIELFAVPELNEPAALLTEGQTTEPIEFGSSVVWIHLDALERTGTSLYDAQLAISQEIRNERTAQELERYIDRLLGRASVSDVEAMLMRLLRIAADRYGPEAS